MLDVVPLLAFRVKVSLSLDLQFLNLNVVLLDQIFAPSYFTSQLDSQFLHLFGLAFDLLVVGLVVFEQLVLLCLCHFFDGFRLHQLLFRFV